MLSCFSHVPLFVTLWILAHQAPLSMGFSKQEYWSQLPCPPPGDHPYPSLTSPALTGRFFTTDTIWETFTMSTISSSFWIFNLLCMCAKSLSCVQLFATLWTVAHRTPLFWGFSRQEYWSQLPCPPPGNLPDLSLRSPALTGRFFTTSATWEAPLISSPPLKLKHVHIFFFLKTVSWVPLNSLFQSRFHQKYSMKSLKSKLPPKWQI